MLDARRECIRVMCAYYNGNKWSRANNNNEFRTKKEKHTITLAEGKKRLTLHLLTLKSLCAAAILNSTVFFLSFLGFFLSFLLSASYTYIVYAAVAVVLLLFFFIVLRRQRCHFLCFAFQCFFFLFFNLFLFFSFYTLPHYMRVCVVQSDMLL